MAATTSDVTPRRNGFEFAAMGAPQAQGDSDEVARLRAAVQTLADMVVAHGVMDARTLHALLGDLVEAPARPSLPPPAAPAPSVTAKPVAPSRPLVSPAQIGARPLVSPAQIAARPTSSRPTVQAPVVAPAPVAPAPVAHVAPQAPVVAPQASAARPTATPVARTPVASAPVVAQPVHAPVAQPVHAPVAQPVHAPVAQPVHAPVAQPVHAPVAQPVHAPVAQPVHAPVARTQPVASVEAPVVHAPKAAPTRAAASAPTLMAPAPVVAAAPKAAHDTDADLPVVHAPVVHVPTPVVVDAAQLPIVHAPIVHTPAPRAPVVHTPQQRSKNPFDASLAAVDVEAALNAPDAPSPTPGGFFGRLFNRKKASPAQVAAEATSIEFTERVPRLPDGDRDGLYSEQQRATELSFPPTEPPAPKPRAAASKRTRGARPAAEAAPSRFCDRCWRRMDASGTCKTCSSPAS